VTTLNQGKYTAGVDGVKMIRGRKGKNEALRLSLLKDINIKTQALPTSFPKSPHLSEGYIPLNPTGKSDH